MSLAITLTKSQVTPTSARKGMTYDPYLLWGAVALICLGLVILTSASMTIGKRNFDAPFHYLIRQLIFLAIGFVAAYYVMKIKIEFWQKNSAWLLVLSTTLLLFVLIPGIGKEVNGSMRWISFGAFNIQPSEIAKLVMIFYLASYCVKKVTHYVPMLTALFSRWLWFVS